MIVRLSSHYQGYTKAGEVEADGATVMQALDGLDRQFPGLKFRLVDEQPKTVL